MTSLRQWRKRLTAWLIQCRLRITDPHWLADRSSAWLAVANHDHPKDWLLLAPWLPDGAILALHPSELPSLRWQRWCDWITFLPLDPLNPNTLKPLVRRLKNGGQVALFASGGTFGDGAVGQIQPAVARLPLMAEVPVIPVWIMNNIWWRSGRIRPPLHLTAFPPRPLLPTTEEKNQLPPELAMTTVLEEAGLAAQGWPSTLWAAACAIVAQQGRATPILEDSTGTRLTYGQWLTRAVLLGRVIRTLTQPGERIGVLLPTSAGALVVLFAILAFGRIPALLNFTVGAGPQRSACRTARLQRVITARRFVDKADLHPMITALSQEVTLHFLEDLAPAAKHPVNLVASWIASFFPAQPPFVTPDSEAAILFTSGTEGEPKGVALSHRAVLTNIRQVQLRVGLHAAPGQECMLNVLPLFHAFGLTVAALAPLLSGIRLCLHPSPLDYRAIADMASRIRPTLMVGTDTFLSSYGRVAHPGDFRSLRIVFSGGEPMREQTRHLWLEKFGVPIFQGYGTTECGPAIAVDTPLQHSADSVGRPLAGIRIHLEPVVGVTTGGRLFVSGPNLMLGYIPPGGDGQVVPVAAPDLGAGWHEVGDVVTRDAEGFLQIIGRLKRFAKIGGEMVSLAAVEALAERVWPECRHAAITLPDPRKGERIVLVTEHPIPKRADFIAATRGEQMAALYIPGHILTVTTLPVLGPGKIDYRAVRTQAEELLQTDANRSG
ncbi:MAG: AMP-binding protein [Magnetococcales bacterium]|nr:AMP-binding protein [Magnetococcales bacterium]NGZ06780.1 AMP-binding protein [Magnetococcales bacterium]